MKKEPRALYVDTVLNTLGSSLFNKKSYTYVFQTCLCLVGKYILYLFVATETKLKEILVHA